MPKTQKYLISMGDYKVQADKPMPFQFENPPWLRRYKFFTHKDFWGEPHNFNLTEFSSGMAVVKNCRTRKQAIENAFKIISNAGRVNFMHTVKNRISKKSK